MPIMYKGCKQCGLQYAEGRRQKFCSSDCKRTYFSIVNTAIRRGYHISSDEADEKADEARRLSSREACDKLLALLREHHPGRDVEDLAFAAELSRKRAA